MMNKRVFSKSEFISKASEDYILVVVDSPENNPILAQKNEKFFARYKISSVPSVLLLKPDGTEYDRFGAANFSTVKQFLNRISMKK